MDFNDLFRAGGDIADAVTDAIDNNDFSELASNIQKTVRDVSDSVARDVRRNSYEYQRQRDRYNQPGGATYRGAGNSYQGTYDNRYEGASWNEDQNRSQTRGGYKESYTPFMRKWPSRNKGLLKVLGGTFGILCGGWLVLSHAVSLLIFGLDASAGFVMIGLLAGAIILAGSIYAVRAGKKERILVARYYQYGRAIGNAEYIEIRKLAQKTHRTSEEVLKDLKLLMEKGLLPQAWLDEQETTLMLSQNVYDQYRTLKRQSEQQQARQNAQVQKTQEQERQEAEDAKLPAEAREILREGRSYILTIHRFNDEIPGQEMSDKLDKLERTMNRIVEQVRKQPGSAADLRRLMQYYLPTTIKLLDAYVQLDKQEITGENIAKTKQEIEEALDMINDAFENLLDSLFQDMAWDISSDISVMKTMFAQDGLTQPEMSSDSGQSAAAKEQQVYGSASAKEQQVYGSASAKGQAAAQFGRQAAGQQAYSPDLQWDEEES